jgi:5-hydroxyisourate hydrolase-like protein (transthyretin family)
MNGKTRTLLLAITVGLSAGQSALGNPAQMDETKNRQATSMTQHRYTGMWVTKDGRIRHELLPNGRYDEARGSRQSAYQGRYEIRGNHIDYWDDTGFTADGEFIDGVLHHAGMILYREK